MLSWKSLSELPLSTLAAPPAALTATIAESETEQTDSGTALRTLILAASEVESEQTEAIVAIHPIWAQVAEATLGQIESVTALRTLILAASEVESEQTETSLLYPHRSSILTEVEAEQTESSASILGLLGSIAEAQSSQTDVIVAIHPIWAQLGEVQSAQIESVLAIRTLIFTASEVESEQTESSVSILGLFGEIDETTVFQTEAIKAVYPIWAQVTENSSEQIEAITALRTLQVSITEAQSEQVEALGSVLGLSGIITEGTSNQVDSGTLYHQIVGSISESAGSQLEAIAAVYPIWAQVTENSSEQIEAIKAVYPIWAQVTENSSEQIESVTALRTLISTASEVESEQTEALSGITGLLGYIIEEQSLQTEVSLLYHHLESSIAEVEIEQVDSSGAVLGLFGSIAEEQSLQTEAIKAVYPIWAQVTENSSEQIEAITALRTLQVSITEAQSEQVEALGSVLGLSGIITEGTSNQVDSGTLYHQIVGSISESAGSQLEAIAASYAIHGSIFDNQSQQVDAGLLSHNVFAQISESVSPQVESVYAFRTLQTTISEMISKQIEAGLAYRTLQFSLNEIPAKQTDVLGTQYRITATLSEEQSQQTDVALAFREIRAVLVEGQTNQSEGLLNSLRPLTSFIAGAISATQVDVIFSADMRVDVAFTNPFSYLIQGGPGGVTIPVTSAIPSGFSPIKRISLILGVSLQSLEPYTITLSSSVKDSEGYDIRPRTYKFTWADMSLPTQGMPLEIPISHFSGEIIGGLLGIPAGQVFFSPAYDLVGASSTLELESISTCTRAFDQYVFPELLDPPALFTFGSGPITTLGPDSVLWAPAERLGLARTHLANAQAEDVLPKVLGESPIIDTTELILYDTLLGSTVVYDYHERSVFVGGSIDSLGITDQNDPESDLQLLVSTLRGIFGSSLNGLWVGDDLVVNGLSMATSWPGRAGGILTSTGELMGTSSLNGRRCLYDTAIPTTGVRYLGTTLPAATKSCWMVLTLPPLPFADYINALECNTTVYSSIMGNSGTSNLYISQGWVHYVNGNLTEAASAGTCIIEGVRAANTAPMFNVGNSSATPAAWAWLPARAFAMSLSTIPDATQRAAAVAALQAYYGI